MSDNAETVPSSEVKPEDAPSTSLFGQTSSSARLFGQFKQNGTSFNTFGQLSINGSTSSPPATSYFTSTVSKLSSNHGGGFGSSSSSLAASLASLGENKQLFGGLSTGTSSSFTDVKTTKDDEADDETENDEENDRRTSSLLEKVAEYEAKRATTHLMANIQGDTSTGEEHEITKFQMTGKLYMYNPEQQQFVERGYGILKINESQDVTEWDKLQARLIMRLDKAFRVILNSPIFPRMTVERATDRSVRFGAQDESHLRIFIIKASATDCANLCKELQSRIQIIERQQATVASNAQSTVTEAANTSPTHNPSSRLRKRSHSKSDSETSDHTNDLSKKSKLIEGYRDGGNRDSSDDDDDDSVESIKTGEQETTG